MSCKWQREVERREKRETRLYTNTEVKKRGYNEKTLKMIYNL